MDAVRAFLHLALALILTSLTCGIGAACASMDERCCCMMEDGASPCTEMSGGSDAPVSPAPASTIESSDRFSVAVVEASPAAGLGATASDSDASASPAPDAAPTPLYLSHCAFLC